MDTIPAQEKIAAFEAKHFGSHPDARGGGPLERGSGSKFKEAPKEKRDHHAALENLHLAETRLALAKTALLDAENNHAEAAGKVAKFESLIEPVDPELVDAGEQHSGNL